MSRMAKSTVLAALLVPLTVGGCKPKPGTTSPEDYYPLIQVALAAGETASMIGRDQAVRDEHFEGCVAAEVLTAAFGSAGEALGGKISDNPVIPGIEVDLADCLAVRSSQDESEEADAAEDTEEAGDENASLSTPVVAVLAAPAEEAPADEASGEEASGEEAPAEEAPAEEASGEEAAPEEPAEEPAEEEEAGIKGNPDAAVLVEAIAGITLTAVLHYANKLKTANCKKGVMALSAVNYINGMIKPIADEIAEPDGKVSVPAYPINLSECSEG